MGKELGESSQHNWTRPEAGFKQFFTHYYTLLSTVHGFHRICLCRSKEPLSYRSFEVGRHRGDLETCVSCERA